MIWLVKTREKAISDGAKNLYVYLNKLSPLSRHFV